MDEVVAVVSGIIDVDWIVIAFLVGLDIEIWIATCELLVALVIYAE